MASTSGACLSDDVSADSGFDFAGCSCADH